MSPPHLQFLLPISEILPDLLPPCFKTLQPPPVSPSRTALSPCHLVSKAPWPREPGTLQRSEPPPGSPLPRPSIGPNPESPRPAQTIAPQQGRLVSIPPSLQYPHVDPPFPRPQRGRAPVTMATPVRTPEAPVPRLLGGSGSSSCWAWLPASSDCSAGRVPCRASCGQRCSR